MSDIKNRSEEEYTELIAEAKFTQMRYEQWKRNFGDQCCSDCFSKFVILK